MSINKILNFLWPQHCIGCKRPSSLNRYGFCKECEKSIILVENLPDTENFHIFKYDGPVREAIHRFKYERKKYYGKKFALLLYDFIRDNKIEEFDIIIPVPLHWKKEFIRGFNQCAVIAFYLSKLVKKRYVSGVLVKSRNTPSQTGMGKKERVENIRESFTVKRPHFIQKKKILLLDDVFTSGATTGEIKKILLKNGAEKVIILTIART